MTHLKTLKLINFAIAAYTFLFGMFGLLWIFIGLWSWGDGQENAWVPILVGLVIFLVLGAISATHIAVGYLVGSGRGRILQTFLAATQLMSFPVGTCYAVYALWVCWADPASIKKFDAVIKPPIS